MKSLNVFKQKDSIGLLLETILKEIVAYFRLAMSPFGLLKKTILSTSKDCHGEMYRENLKAILKTEELNLFLSHCNKNKL